MTTETYEDGPAVETYEQGDPEWGHQMNRRRTVGEAAAQYETLMKKIEAYDGPDHAYVAFVLGAAYALKWMLGEEDGSEFDNESPRFGG